MDLTTAGALRLVACPVLLDELEGVLARDKFLRWAPESSSTAYRRRAKKGRAGTYLDIYDAQYRAYIVLRTDPDRQHIVWSWWKTREYRARYDIGETFR